MLISALALAGACGSDAVCGPGEAPVDGVLGTSGTMLVQYGGFTSSPNNDCTVAGSPTSLTIEGRQLGSTRPLVLCVPRPDEIGVGAISLADGDHIQLIDLFADSGDCLLSLDRSTPPSGTITFSGFCGDGVDDAGYAIEFSGNVQATLMCPTGDSSVSLELSGSAAVEALSR